MSFPRHRETRPRRVRHNYYKTGYCGMLVFPEDYELEANDPEEILKDVQIHKEREDD